MYAALAGTDAQDPNQPAPSDDEIRRHLMPNLCRCGTHMRILRAVGRAARAMQNTSTGNTKGSDP